MNPLVSIIIPVFNQNEDYLRDCLDSALAQSYKNLEIIISENHSTNGSAQVIAQYQDSRIKVFCPQTFLSMNDNFAFAASCTTENSKYLSFLSSDDLLAPNAIEELVAFAENNPSAGFIAGNIIQSIEPPASFEQLENTIRTPENKLGLYTFKEAIDMFCPWRESSTWMAGNLIKHDAYKSTGGFYACDYYVLGDLWLTKELLKQPNSAFACISLNTAYFRRRAQGVLPPDGDRSLSTDLDMLRYATDMLLLVKGRGIKLKQLGLIHLVRVKKICRLILFILHSRKFGYPFNPSDLDQLLKHVKNMPPSIGQKLLSQALSVKGFLLSAFAALAASVIGSRLAKP